MVLLPEGQEEPNGKLGQPVKLGLCLGALLCTISLSIHLLKET